MMEESELGETTSTTTVETLVHKLSSVSEQTRTESLCKLRLLSKNEPDTRPMIISAGAIPYISESLYSPCPVSQENSAATLLNLSIHDRHSVMSTNGLLDALSHALRNPTSPSASQSTSALLFSLLMEDHFRPIIGSKRDIIYALVDLIRNASSHPRSVKDALKALFGICLCQGNRGTVIELGAVPVLFSLVMKDGRVGIVEDVTAVIGQVAGCQQAWEEFGKVGGVGVLVDLLDLSTGCSYRIKENAVSGLLNLVEYGREEVVDSLRTVGTGLVNGISEVVNNGSVKGKSKASALLKMLHGAASCDHLDSSFQIFQTVSSS
ncbi:U-box domain-containing protein 19 [Apium graveolens]|uniref:U-box domain-containing protein 19 n=1 Tax=Apium graveolens TaxID=4045 RepID=UPI003D7C1309